jgi:hypothetical protein
MCAACFSRDLFLEAKKKTLPFFLRKSIKINIILKKLFPFFYIYFIVQAHTQLTATEVPCGKDM